MAKSSPGSGRHARWQPVHRHREPPVGGGNRASRRAELRNPRQIRQFAQIARQIHDECPRCELFAYANCPCCGQDHVGVAQ